MKIIGKIIAIPFILALTILVALLCFLTCISGVIFGVISSILGLGGIGLIVTGQTYIGIGVLVIGVLLSPFGLPALAEWFTGLLGGLNDMLKGFVMS